MGGGHLVCLPVTAGSPPSLGGGSVYSLIMSDLVGNQSAVGFHSHPGKIIIEINPFLSFTTVVVYSLICLCTLTTYIANNMDPDQTVLF